MNILHRRIYPGSTSRIVEVMIEDSTSPGNGKTGLLYSNVMAYYDRSGSGGGTSITMATMTLGTWASGGFIEKDATNMPGVYQFGLPNAVIATGAKEATVIIKGTGILPVAIQIELDGVLLDSTYDAAKSAASSAALTTAQTAILRAIPSAQANAIAVWNPSTTFPDTSLLTNGGMENDTNSDNIPDQFTRVTGTITGSPVYSRPNPSFASGNFAARCQYTGVSGDSNAWFGAYQGDKIAVNSDAPGQTIYLASILKGILTGCSLAILIQAWDSSQAYISSYTKTISAGGLSSSPMMSYINYTLPVGTAYVSIAYQPSAIDNGDVFDLYVDSARLFFPNLSSSLLIADGDSMMWGAGAQPGTSDLLTLMSVPTTWTRINMGLSAAHLSSLVGQTWRCDTFYDYRRPHNVCLIWAGTNDLALGGRTPTQVYNDTVTYCNNRRSAGYKVIVFTILPRLAMVTSPTFEADRQTFNTNLRANWQTFADAIVDVAADSRFSDPTNTTYYADQLHLTAVGNGVVAGLATTALGTLVNLDASNAVYGSIVPAIRDEIDANSTSITLINDFLQADVEYNKTAKTITWKHKDTGAVLLTKTDSTVDNVETVG